MKKNYTNLISQSLKAIILKLSKVKVLILFLTPMLIYKSNIHINIG